MNGIINFFKKRPLVSLLLIFSFWVNSLPLPDQNVSINKQYNQFETTISNQKALSVCGGDCLPGLLNKKKEKFDIVLHAKLMKTFPDWPGRMDYQKKQEKFYKSAVQKQIQLKRLRIRETSGFYTKEETDAINYFHGKGFYAKAQDSTMKPNIFDTRQSFLRKMHNPVMRKNFIKSYKRIYK